MIVAFTGTRPLGQHFMDWSFRYLTRTESFWHWEKGTVALIPQPVSDQPNAHQHKMNHIRSTQIEEFLSKAKERQMEHHGVITVWPNVSGEHLQDFFERFSTMLVRLSADKVKTVVIRKTMPYPYYVDRTGKSEQTVIDEARKEFGVESHDPRQIRETLAFNITKATVDPGWIFDRHQANDDTLIIDDRDWIEHPKKCLEKICKFTGQDLMRDRLDGWEEVQAKWIAKYRKVIEFYEDMLPVITKSIVHNESLYLGGKNIGFVKQAAIMAHLMKDHGRRLLLPSEEFPKNTKDLHRFLK